MRRAASGILLAVLALAGCATPEEEHPVRQQADDEAVQPYSPLPPRLTPEQEAQRAEARHAYVECLDAAAHYADKNGQAIDIAAALIAPMCYPQFARFEATSVVGMDSRDQRAYDRAGDKRQVEMAGDAIRRERGVAALSPAQQ